MLALVFARPTQRDLKWQLHLAQDVEMSAALSSGRSREVASKLTRMFRVELHKPHLHMP